MDWQGKKALRPIYTWVRFRIKLAHFPNYKNNYILKNTLAYCEIALRNRTCKQAFTHVFVQYNQGDQIGRNFAIWAIFYGVGRIFF